MAIVVIPYDIQIDHDGKKYDVHVPKFSVPKCQNEACGAVSFDERASEQIDEAFRRTAGLLTPDQIRQGRTKVGYSLQQEFAACLGVSVSTVSRWENGSQIQQTFYDDMMRAFFQVPQFRQFLAERHGLTPKDLKASVA